MLKALLSASPRRLRIGFDIVSEIEARSLAPNMIRSCSVSSEQSYLIRREILFKVWKDCYHDFTRQERYVYRKPATLPHVTKFLDYLSVSPIRVTTVFENPHIGAVSLLDWGWS